MSNGKMTQICQRHGCRKQALRKFCSPECRVAHHNGRRPPASKVKITCLGCGGIFQGRPDQKTCGATCRSRLFRTKHYQESAKAVGGGASSIEWGALAQFSALELRQKMQSRSLELNAEYSWLPANPKKVRVRRPKHNPNQMHFDFGNAELTQEEHS